METTPCPQVLESGTHTHNPVHTNSCASQARRQLLDPTSAPRNSPRGSVVRMQHRPTLLLLGDSRSRWMLMHNARLCDTKLQYRFELGAPRVVNSSRAIDEALDGVGNWRGGGGYICTNDSATNTSASALAAVGYFLHYGVSPVGPCITGEARTRAVPHPATDGLAARSL